ncbi:methionyl-tRNA formyltransferase [uncultured Aquimarina sp.]|uniref:methionyl-tRNA formyltransferase n=1 Tax=uncultured Aquimarina sp. TaxID=575652 RepID=UPI00262C715A|nr:formyltransferase family protein [uncultured Aquimarina sp.]
MKIFFIGTVEFSKITLEKLIELRADIVGVATRSESKFNADFADLISVCKEHNINYRTIKNVNSPEALSWIRSLGPDIIFCFGWSNLLKRDLLNLAPMGVVGYHPAELPMNRGRHPIIWALVLGLQQTASTFFFMEEGADDGDILSQKRVSIDITDDAQSLYDKLTATALNQIEEFHTKLEANTYERIKQDHSKANLWRKRGRSDGMIDFRMSSEAIYNLVRGLTKPYVGAHIEIGDEETKVWKTEIGDGYKKNIEPGKVLKVDNQKILVKTGDGTIWLTKHDFAQLPELNSYL